MPSPETNLTGDNPFFDGMLPIGFFMIEWREGKKGASLMGSHHGIYRAGCCWFLMDLLFVAGVMNLLWVAMIAGYVLVEKSVPDGNRVRRAACLVAITFGADGHETIPLAIARDMLVPQPDKPPYPQNGWRRAYARTSIQFRRIYRSSKRNGL